MPAPDKRGYLQETAIGLCELDGCDTVTIDDITRRSAYFRYFATEEDSVLADHEDRVALFRRLLAQRSMHVFDRSFTESVTEAIRARLPGAPLGGLQARMLAAAGVELVNAVLAQ